VWKKKPGTKSEKPQAPKTPLTKPEAPPTLWKKLDPKNPAAPKQK
jgi:hypothetical protein